MSKLEITVRACSLDDVPTLAQFQYDMAIESEDLYLDFEILSEGCKNLVLKPKYGVFYVAEIIKDEKVIPVGCILSTFEM